MEQRFTQASRGRPSLRILSSFPLSLWSSFLCIASGVCVSLIPPRILVHTTWHGALCNVILLQVDRGPVFTIERLGIGTELLGSRGLTAARGHPSELKLLACFGKESCLDLVVLLDSEDRAPRCGEKAARPVEIARTLFGHGKRASRKWGEYGIV